MHFNRVRPVGQLDDQPFVVASGAAPALAVDQDVGARRLYVNGNRCPPWTMGRPVRADWKMPVRGRVEVAARTGMDTDIRPAGRAAGPAEAAPSGSAPRPAVD